MHCAVKAPDFESSEVGNGSCGGVASILVKLEVGDRLTGVGNAALRRDKEHPRRRLLLESLPQVSTRSESIKALS